MTIGSKVFGILLSLLLLLSVAPASAEERSFEIGEVNIHAIIDSNGNMQITEKDTYRFNGSFNGILIDLNSTGSDGIEDFKAYEVSEGGNTPLEFEQSGDGASLQYKVYSTSVDTTKVFQISYMVKNVVQVYADTAELYWKFFDVTNANELGKVKIAIELPKGVTKEEITTFGHGPLDGSIHVDDDSRILFQVDSLPAGQMLEARVLFPTDTVLGSKKISDEEMLDKILEEERNWKASDANLESSNDYTVPGALLLLLANLAVGFTIYIRYRKQPKSDWKGDYYRDLPSDASPAFVSFLLDSRIEPRDLMATLLDFVRRKYITMSKERSAKIGDGKHDYSFKWTKKDTSKLLPHETMLLEWFFKEIGKNDRVSYSEIISEASLRQDFPGKWGEWKQHVEDTVIEHKYMRKNSGIYRWVILAFLVQFFGFMFLASEDWSWLLFCSIPLPFFKPKRYQRTTLGQTEYEKWKAFGRFLRAYSRIEKRDAMEIHLWDHYFVYAIPLGAAKKMIKDMKVKILNKTDKDYSDFTLYHSAAILEYDRLDKLFKDAVAESQKSNSSSSSDSGGWFSSGGGDGGGGGGRGAF
jgi:uncharacterized membrane protein